MKQSNQKISRPVLLGCVSGNTLKWVSVSALILAAASSPLSLAGPSGGSVVGGAGSINVDGNTTSINQLTNKMAVDWQSFNVKANETVRFLQPNASSIALNRVLGGDPSHIFGVIEANGHVILSNTSGILFTESSVLNVNSLVASGLTMSPADFMNGQFLFQSENGREGFVINRGVINASSGAVLLGNRVANEGAAALIKAELVSLQAGSEAVLTFDSEGMIGVRVTREVLENQLGVDAAVANSGAIQAGSVLLEANVAADLFDMAVNNSGRVQSVGIDTTGGVVRLVGNRGRVVHSGHIDGTSKDTGAHVEVLGESVIVEANATIDVSGDLGGGTILIGGDYQGRGETQTALNTQVGEGAILKSDARVMGDGGQVIVWSDDTTTFRGDISARGGALGGDGGFAEVSGKQHVLVDGHADLRAPLGKAGLLLLDPGTVNIRVGGNTNSNDDEFNDGWINNQLTLGSLSILTDNASAGAEDILFDANVAISWANTNTLTFDAGANITFNSGVSITDGGSGGTLVLNFGQDGGASSMDLSGATVDVDAITIAGGAGTNALIGASTYTVAGSDAGTAADGALSHTASFTSIESLTGTSAGDSFTFADGSTLTGIANGLGGDDTFILGDNSSLGAAITVGTLDGGADNDKFEIDDALTGLSATSISGGAGSDTLEGSGAADTFGFNNTDGNVTVNNTNLASAVSFSGIETVEGDTGADQFNFADDAVHTGTVLGEAGNDTFTFGDSSNSGGAIAVGTLDGGADSDTFVIDDALTGLTGTSISGGTGGADADTLQGTSGNDTFNLTTNAKEAILAALGQLFTNLEVLDGNGGASDSVVADSGGSTFTFLTGVDQVQTNSMGLTDVDSFGGGVGGDNFNFNSGATVNTDISGGAGSDTFTFGSGAGDVTVNGTVDGGDDADTFVIDDSLTALSVTSITGGSGGTDLDTVQGTSGDDIFNLTANAKEVILASLSQLFAGIEVINGSGGAGDSVVAHSGGSTFTFLTGVDQVQANSMALDSVENFTGGAGNDTFNFADGATVSFDVLGGAGDDSFIFGDSTTNAAISVANVDGQGDDDTFSVTDTLTDLNALGVIDGGTGDDTLVGRTVDDVFQLTATAGQVVFNAITQAFSGLENLTGNGGTDAVLADGTNGSAFDLFAVDRVRANGILLATDIQAPVGGAGADTFNFADGATVTFSVSGNGGNDVFIFGDNSNSGAAITVAVVDGGADNDKFEIDDALTGLSATSISGGAGIDTLEGSGATDTFGFGSTDGTVTVNNTNLASAVTFGGIETVEGDAGADQFNFADDTAHTGTVLGEAGNDTFTFGDNSNSGAAIAVGTLDGGAGSDTFVIDDALAGLAGTSISGGTGGADVDALQGTSGNDTFNLTTNAKEAILAALGQLFTNLEVLDGNGGASDSVVADSGGSTFTFLTGVDQVQANSMGLSDVDSFGGGAGGDSFNFNSGATVNTDISGGAGSDTFTFGSGAGDVTVNGTVDGGDDADTFVIDDSLTALSVTSITGGSGGTDLDTVQGTSGNDIFNLTANAKEVILASLSQLFAGIEVLNGSGGAGDSVVAHSGGSTFSFLAGVDQVQANSMALSSVESFAGGAGNDTFNFNTDATINADVSGGAGNDSFGFGNGVGMVTVNGMVDGGADDDIFTIHESLTGLSVTSITGGNGGTDSDTLQGTAGNDVVNLTANANEAELDALSQLFEGIENLAGNGGTDSVVAHSAGSTFDFLAGADQVRANGMLLMGFEAPLGAAGADVFNFNSGATVNTNVSGGAGNDTFNFGSGVGAVTVNGVVDGGDDNDTFTIHDSLTALSVTSITGGSGGTNLDELQGTNGNDVFSLTVNAKEVILSAINQLFTNIEVLDGSGGANDSVAAHSGGSIFEFSAGTDQLHSMSMNLVDIESVVGGVGADVFNFASSSLVNTNIDAGAGGDTFNFGDGSGAVIINGAIDAGTGSDTFQFNNSLSNMTVNGSISGGSGVGVDTLLGLSVSDTFLLTSTNGEVSLVGYGLFRGLEQVDGNGGGDTLTTATAGSVVRFSSGGPWLANSISFDQIDDVVGGAGNDRFIFEDGVNTTASVSGGDGADEFVFGDNGASGAAIAVGVINGGLGGDTFIIASLLKGLTGTFTGGASGVDTLLGSSGNELFMLNNTTVGQLQYKGASFAGDTVFSGIDIVNGNGGEDTVVSATDGRSWQLVGTDGVATQSIEFQNIAAVTSAGVGDILLATAAGSSVVLNSGADRATANGIGFSGVESYFGGGGADTFRSENGAAISGAISGEGGADVFNLTGGISVASGIDGGAGDDRFVVAASVSGGVTGGADNDSFEVAQLGDSSSLDGGAGTADQLIFTGDTSNWSFPLGAGPALNGISLVGMESYVDGATVATNVITNGTASFNAVRQLALAGSVLSYNAVSNLNVSAANIVVNQIDHLGAVDLLSSAGVSGGGDINTASINIVGDAMTLGDIDAVSTGLSASGPVTIGRVSGATFNVVNSSSVQVGSLSVADSTIATSGVLSIGAAKGSSLVVGRSGGVQLGVTDWASVDIETSGSVSQVGADALLTAGTLAIAASGDVNLATQVSEVSSIRSTNGDITLNERDSITLGVVEASGVGAAISIEAVKDITFDAITTGSASNGSVSLASSQGDLLVSRVDLTSATLAPNVIANSMDLTALLGVVGKNQAQFITLSATRAPVVSSLLGSSIRTTSTTPEANVVSGANLGNAFDAVSSSGVASAVQTALDGIESVDPAVFTALTPYSFDANAVAMPEDQKDDYEE